MNLIVNIVGMVDILISALSFFGLRLGAAYPRLIELILRAS